MIPLVSIILPTRNSGHFLQKRLKSIWAQTLTDWEMLVVDSESTDGSLPLLKSLPEKDSRISFFEMAPGLYQAWNFAIQKARGKYVFMATADDAMTADALKKMSDALESHPECEVCDSRLKLIDENDHEIPVFSESYVAHHWHVVYPREVRHIRLAPADFFAHLGGKTVYTSIGQLLIRRSLFEKTGLFPENYGPSADFMWGMRAALYSNVYFIPESLVSWRIHPGQATTSKDAEKINKNYFLMSQMAQHVLKEIPPELFRKARKTAHLVRFKGILLPAKRTKYSLLEKSFLISKAFFYAPLLTVEFLLTVPYYACKIPREFIFIYTYDKMIYRHTKCFYHNKIIHISKTKGKEND